MKIIQIMPVPDNIAVGDMCEDFYTHDIVCEEIGKHGDPRACVLALVEDENGQRVVPLVWDFDTQAFELTDDMTGAYAIAAVSKDFFQTGGTWNEIFKDNIELCKSLRK